MAWKRTVLVVANVTADASELREVLEALSTDEPASFRLLVPATGGARSAARRRMEAAVAALRDAGLDVEGRVGDPDPVVAVREEWSPREYDEVVVSTLPSAASKWLLCDVPHRIERLTGAPVIHVVPAERRAAPVGGPAPERPDYGVLAPFAGAFGRGGPGGARAGRSA